MAYTGTDVMMRPVGMGFGGEPPMDFDPNNPPEGMEMPEDFQPGQMPEDMEMPEGFRPDQMPEGMGKGEKPEGMEMPEGFRPDQMPEGMEGFQPGEAPNGQPPQGMGFPGGMESGGETGDPNGEFYMQDQVNFFSGLQKA
jgi:hypothetical protein